MKPIMSRARRPLCVGLYLSGSLLLGGCHETPAGAPVPAAAETKAKSSGAAEAAAGVSIKPEEIASVGIVTSAARATIHSPEALGFGVVVMHESIALAAAELVTAIAAERQSRAALDRAQRLEETAGAMPADVREAAVRQAAVDQAALMLARQRLSASYGQNAPWKNADNSTTLNALAGGEIKLVRVTFPLGALGDAAPTSLRLSHIDASIAGKSWKTTALWAAPADASVPGKSFFALLQGSDAGEGERLLAWAPIGPSDAGVVIPEVGVVISDGKYWCYVERKPGTFARVEVDTSTPVENGYFVKNGVAPGDQIVTAAVGQLLARESNPGTAAE